jgi:hypothetical protein
MRKEEEDRIFIETAWAIDDRGKNYGAVFASFLMLLSFSVAQ